MWVDSTARPQRTAAPPGPLGQPASPVPCGGGRQGPRPLDAWAAGLGLAALILYRLILSDTERKWDEELYFQIARHWSGDLVPYRDIFDHKPPFLYLYLKVFSLNGESFATFRLVCALLLALSLFRVWASLRQDMNVLFIPFCYGLLSLPDLAGTNSEIIYIPFILMTLTSALDGRFILAGAFAALAVSIKYTVVLDLLGVMLLYLAIRGPNRQLLVSIAVASALSALIFAAFYAYFRAHGVDLVFETIGRNLVHSGTSRSPFELPNSFVACCVVCAATIGLGLVLGWKSDRFARLLPPLAAWFLLSAVQAGITGKYYSHYFAPVIIPAAILSMAAVAKAGRRAMAAAGVAALVAGLAVNAYAWHLLSRYRDTARRVAEYCDRGPFHYHGSFLAAYRVCDDFVPQKYMFPLFYVDEHFVRVSGSGGRAWLCDLDLPVLREGTMAAPGLVLYADGAAYCAAEPHR